MANIGIFEVSFGKKELDKLPDDERRLFLLLGHIHNEISVLQKMWLWSLSEPRELIRKRAQFMQAFTLSKVIAGKVFEANLAISKAYEVSKLREKYHKKLSKKSRVTLTELRKELPFLKRIRNKFANHYSLEMFDVPEDIESYTSDLALYFSPQSGNNLFFSSEIILHRNALPEHSLSDLHSELKKFYDKIIAASRHVTDFTKGVLSVIIDEHDKADSLFEKRAMYKLRVKHESNVNAITYFSDGKNN